MLSIMTVGVVYGVDVDLGSTEQVQSESAHIENLHIWDRFVSTPDNNFACTTVRGDFTNNKVTLYELLWGDPDACGSSHRLFVC